LMKALNYLTSEQLQKLGQAALNKASEIKISDEESCSDEEGNISTSSKAYDDIADADKETIEDFLYQLATKFRKRAVDEDDSYFDESAESLDNAAAFLMGRGRPY